MITSFMWAKAGCPFTSRGCASISKGCHALQVSPAEGGNGNIESRPRPAARISCRNPRCYKHLESFKAWMIPPLRCASCHSFTSEIGSGIELCHLSFSELTRKSAICVKKSEKFFKMKMNSGFDSIVGASS